MRALSDLRSGLVTAPGPLGSLGSLPGALMVGRRRSPSVEVVVSSSLSRRHISRRLKHNPHVHLMRHVNVEATDIDRASLEHIAEQEAPMGPMRHV